MGSAAAWELAARGHAVVLLERFAQSHARGSSHGTTRMFRLAYAEPAYVRLGLDAIDGWRRLEAETGRSLVELTGCLDHGEIDGLEDVFAAAGVTFERLVPDAAAERWPGLLIDRAAVWH